MPESTEGISEGQTTAMSGKNTKYRWFYILSAAKNWKKFQSGVRHKYTSYGGVVLESR